MPSIRDIALSEAKETLNFSADTLASVSKLAGKAGDDASFSMFPRHAEELHRYLSAHRAKLVQWQQKVRGLPQQPDEQIHPPENPPTDPSIHLLGSYRFDLDSAVRFVEEAFLKPRRSPDSARILEAADWYCVDAFQELLSQTTQGAGDKVNFPVGPIVALDSQRSPAVWKETAELKIPSLFTESITVRPPGGSASALPPFPVVCLPADLIHLPEYLVLLAHEVGHVADDAKGLSSAILELLDKDPSARPHIGFWRAWMREIIADAAAVVVAGEAFAHALWRFMGRRSIDRSLTESNPYPPSELRLVFLRLMLGIADEDDVPGLPGASSLGMLPGKATVLKDAFQKTLLPQLKAKLPGLASIPNPAMCGVADAVTRLKSSVKPDLGTLETLPFVRMPSVFTLAIQDESDQTLRAKFKDWHFEYRQNKPPGWIKEQSNWKFTEDMLPTLRATLLGTDGVTKYPPIVLLAAHHSITFVGSTNKWLAGALKKALEHREGRAWERIDIFFASDNLLKQVERYDKDSETKWPWERLKEERNEHIEILKTLFRENQSMIKSASFRYFHGPALFASYWDSDARHGRIHVSTQLLGMDIGVCPATDHIWLREEPSPAYLRYQDHLRMLEKTAGQEPSLFTLPESLTLT